MTDHAGVLPSAAALPRSTPLNSPARVLLASLIGTTIEFFDFYVYATAAVLVFPTLFFPNSDPTTALLASFATFSIAFFARPFGAIVFGHFGDKVGRKTTLVAALLTMGISTVVIGLLPGYAQIGVAAPLLLALCRFGQGFGLGGEWGGAVLLATENAPEGKHNWYAMFPQLGAPVGLFLSSSVFWGLLHFISQDALLKWGWRVPFLASIVLIAIGLWVRLSITETPEFQKAIDKAERVAVPGIELLRRHKRSLFLGTFVGLLTFVFFYICTAYLLSYNVKVVGMSFVDALKVQIFGAVVFGIANIAAGLLADRIGRRELLLGSSVLIGVFSFALAPLLTGGIGGIYVFTLVAMALFGLNYGVIGAALAAPFPTAVRYTGSSITFNMAGIFGASLAPYIATWLQANYGLQYIGYYLLAAVVITVGCILVSPKHEV
ncbi:MAG: ral substrate transporter [Tardiphaga sp.]|nr:ral substrate transporter [Tardiphaga sp.]